jgi:uncharacterized protein YndB with AHSA1/START domain
MSNLHPWPRSGNTLDFMQHIRAAAEPIWDAITTEAGLQQWLAVTSAEIPLVPGSRFHLTWETRGQVSGKSEHGFEGTVAAVVPNRLLALEWILPYSKAVTHFSVQIQPSFAMFGEDVGPECDIWLIHSGFPSDGPGLYEFDGHSRHWRQSFGDLAAQLEARPGKPTPYALAGLQFVGGAQDRGLLVADVLAGSPADVAGIRGGDVIKAVDGLVLHALDDFHDWIDERLPGETGEFTLSDRTVNVTVEGVEQARHRLLVRQNDGWITRR